MKTKNVKNILAILITILIYLIILNIGCTQDECTKQARKSRYTSTTLKSSNTSKSTVDGFVPHTRENPYWMDWEGRNINLDSLSGWYLAGMGVNPDGSYYVKSWIGFQNSITIPEGKVLHIRSLNCVIKGSIHGTGTLIFESYQEGKEYNSPIGGVLVVEELVDDSVNLVMNDNTTLEELGRPLDNDNPTFSDSEIVEVECSMELPYIWRDPETGITWKYEEV